MSSLDVLPAEVAGPTGSATSAAPGSEAVGSVPPVRYRFGSLTLDTRTLQLVDGDDEVALEPQVLGVLIHLVEHRDRVVPKTELLDAAWGSRFVSESALTTRIKQARQAVGDDGQRQAVIRTRHGRGYRFVAPVVVEGEEPTAPASLPHPARIPETRYAEADGASIAYQTFGEGPDVVLVAGFATNVEVQWEHPSIARFLQDLGRLARVTLLDKRGVGLSDRVSPEEALSLETRADDLRAVMDAAGIERATILGSSEGGSLGAVFAATHAERVERLILHSTWMMGPAVSREGSWDLDWVLRRWGSGRLYAHLAPSLAAEPGGTELLSRFERLCATPRTARHLLELIGQIDITEVLAAVSVPTLVLHRVDDPVIPIEHGRQIASRVPGAQLVELAGADHYLCSGDPTETLAAIERFLADEPPRPWPTRTTSWPPCCSSTRPSTVPAERCAARSACATPSRRSGSTSQRAPHLRGAPAGPGRGRHRRAPGGPGGRAGPPRGGVGVAHGHRPRRRHGPRLRGPRHARAARVHRALAALRCDRLRRGGAGVRDARGSDVEAGGSAPTTG